MPRLFSYGTLQQDDVQRATFGRRLRGHPDELPGYDLSSVRIDDPARAQVYGRTHNANVVFSGRAESRVSGTAFDITNHELESADRYEAADGYTRQEVTLASGVVAWVYMWRADPSGSAWGAGSRP